MPEIEEELESKEVKSERFGNTKFEAPVSITMGTRYFSVEFKYVCNGIMSDRACVFVCLLRS